MGVIGVTDDRRLDRCAVDMQIRMGMRDEGTRPGSDTVGRHVGDGQRGLNQRQGCEDGHCEFRHGLSAPPTWYVKRPMCWDLNAGYVMRVSRLVGAAEAPARAALRDREWAPPSACVGGFGGIPGWRIALGDCRAHPRNDFSSILDGVVHGVEPADQKGRHAEIVVGARCSP
jgi:hypothetical protein